MKNEIQLNIQFVFYLKRNIMNNEKVENYAKSLVKHGLYSTIDEARAESIRWYKKAERGLLEPLQCPHHPDIETTVTHTENGGMIVEYKLPKN